MDRIQEQAEQRAKAMAMRAHFEQHVTAIFSGFLGSFLLMTALLFIAGLWLAEHLPPLYGR